MSKYVFEDRYLKQQRNLTAFYYGVKTMSISQKVFHSLIAERFPFKALPTEAMSLHPNVTLASPNYF